MHCALAIIDDNFLDVEKSEFLCWPLKSVCFAYVTVIALLLGIDSSTSIINPLTAEWALRALIDFTLSNARRFYSSNGNPLDGKGLRNTFNILCKCLPLSGKVECEVTMDGKFVERKTAFIRRVRQIMLRSSVFLLWNVRKATLGFGGATNSEFAEFLVHFSAYEVSWAFYKPFTGLSNTMVPFIRVEFFNFFFSYTVSIWLVEFWHRINLEMQERAFNSVILNDRELDWQESLHKIKGQKNNITETIIGAKWLWMMTLN